MLKIKVSVQGGARVLAATLPVLRAASPLDTLQGAYCFSQLHIESNPILFPSLQIQCLHAFGRVCAALEDPTDEDLPGAAHVLLLRNLVVSVTLHPVAMPLVG